MARMWQLSLLRLAGVVLLIWPASLPAQVPPPAAHAPVKHVPPPAPLLQIRIIAPPGAQATFFPDAVAGRAFDAPISVGVRPGYVYRFRLGNLSDNKDVALYPTLEVIGTLHMPPPCCAANYPAPITFSQDEINRALSGAYLTKVIVLENPDKAVPVPTNADQPLETVIRPEECLLDEARLLGRPLLIVRVGGRAFTPEELLAQAVPGTMLMPGDKALGPPAAPPYLPWQCMQVVDPLLGPKPPVEECFHDGGDVGTPVGFDKEGTLRGLDPSDTVAEYTDECGKHLTISNRVCLCVPRYNVVKTEIVPVGYETAQVPLHAQMVQPQIVLKSRVPPLPLKQAETPEVAKQKQQPDLMRGRITPIIYEELISTGLVIGEIEGKVVIGTAKKECPPPCRPLILCKSLDKCCAQIGDVVTFTLKYTNPGGQPINEVVVSDSLIGRLEYVPGSQRSDRTAVFTTSENQAGSLILRWQVSGSLLPGQSGVITFQARIR